MAENLVEIHAEWREAKLLQDLAVLECHRVIFINGSQSGGKSIWDTLGQALERGVAGGQRGQNF